jgi:16S rRNA (guanine(527)-N(7))-methyltransferase RsmG
VSGQPSFAALLAPHAAAEEAARLAHYAELVERWSARHNLVSFANRRELVDRHIVDALAGAEALSGSGRLLDVGSGAGLPGVPLLVVRPDWRGVLLEPRQKRWAFLKVVIRELGLDAEAVRSRYAELDAAARWDRIAARAVGGHEALLEWARGHLDACGEVMLWTTAETEVALSALPGWRVLSSRSPGLDRGRLCRLRPCFT